MHSELEDEHVIAKKLAEDDLAKWLGFQSMLNREVSTEEQRLRLVRLLHLHAYNIRIYMNGDSFADVPKVVRPSLSGRLAKCPVCRRETKSDWALNSFEHRPASTMDGFCCGLCYWDRRRLESLE